MAKIKNQIEMARWILASGRSLVGKLFFEVRTGHVPLALMDSTDTKLLEKSVGYHFSITSLEHIPKTIIKDIFTEAKRILKPNELAIYFVDLSDHFQHQDASIKKVNFLRYNEN